MYRDSANANNQTISFYANNTKKMDIAENRIICKEDILGVDGTVTNPSYSFESDPDCGIYRTASNQVVLHVMVVLLQTLQRPLSILVLLEMQEN